MLFYYLLDLFQFVTIKVLIYYFFHFFILAEFLLHLGSLREVLRLHLALFDHLAGLLPQLLDLAHLDLQKSIVLQLDGVIEYHLLDSLKVVDLPLLLADAAGIQRRAAVHINIVSWRFLLFNLLVVLIKAGHQA